RRVARRTPGRLAGPTVVAIPRVAPAATGNCPGRAGGRRRSGTPPRGPALGPARSAPSSRGGAGFLAAPAMSTGAVPERGREVGAPAPRSGHDFLVDLIGEKIAARSA